VEREGAEAPWHTRQGGGQLESLPPLPDTAQEVREIAKILQAEEYRDVYLGRVPVKAGSRPPSFQSTARSCLQCTA
jgi:hypothetical protein